MNLILYLDDQEKHPLKVMVSLGIKYKACESSPIFDCWFFYGCSNVPRKLPEFIRETSRSQEFEGRFLDGLDGRVYDNEKITLKK
jgi:hypothetical protein